MHLFLDQSRVLRGTVQSAGAGTNVSTGLGQGKLKDATRTTLVP